MSPEQAMQMGAAQSNARLMVIEEAYGREVSSAYAAGMACNARDHMLLKKRPACNVRMVLSVCRSMRKRQLGLGEEMSIRPDMQSLADELGTPAPVSEPGTAKHVPIKSDIYEYFLKIAKRKRTTIGAVIPGLWGINEPNEVAAC